jgi:hypothetical protein
MTVIVRGRDDRVGAITAVLAHSAIGSSAQ